MVDPSGLSGSDKMERKVNLEAICGAILLNIYFMLLRNLCYFYHILLSERKYIGICHQSNKLLKFKSTMVL